MLPNVRYGNKNSKNKRSITQQKQYDESQCSSYQEELNYLSVSLNTSLNLPSKMNKLRYAKDLLEIIIKNRDFDHYNRFDQSDYTEKEQILSTIQNRELQLGSSFYKERIYKKKTILQKSDFDISLMNHIDLQQDKWNKSHLIGGILQYFKINIQNISLQTRMNQPKLIKKFPLTLTINTRQSECLAFFAYFNHFPDDLQNNISSKFKGYSALKVQDNYRLQKDTIYVYLSIICQVNTIIEVKVTFEDTKKFIPGPKIRHLLVLSQKDLIPGEVDQDEINFYRKLERIRLKESSRIDHRASNCEKAFFQDNKQVQLENHITYLNDNTIQVNQRKFKLQTHKALQLNFNNLSKEVIVFLKQKEVDYEGKITQWPQKKAKALVNYFDKDHSNQKLIQEIHSINLKQIQLHKIIVFFKNKFKQIGTRFCRSYLSKIIKQKGTLIERVRFDVCCSTKLLANQIIKKVKRQAKETIKLFFINHVHHNVLDKLGELSMAYLEKSNLRH